MRIARTLAVLAFGMSGLLFAIDEAGQKVQAANTEHMDFPAAGVLHVTKSIGDLTVEGWDRPDVEIVSVKSTQDTYDSHEREKPSHRLDQVRVRAERRGNEVVITTDLPRRRRFPPPSPLKGAIGIDLDYHIRVPRDARLIVDHQAGEVHVTDLTGDIHATVLSGEISLSLPQEGQYSIDAKSDFGNVICGFAGQERRGPWPFGHKFAQEGSPTTGHKLYLRVGYGDIIILKAGRPSNSGK